MYKCLVCGHIFAHGEEAEWTEAHGERWTGCPVCKSSYEETVRCGHCSGEHLEDELYGGWCMECIAEAVTYDRALAYMSARDYGDGQNYLVDFIFEWIWDASAPARFGQTLRDVVRSEFARRKFNDIACGVSTFLDKCKAFILSGDGDCGADDFAKWLTEEDGCDRA